MGWLSAWSEKVLPPVPNSAGNAESVRQRQKFDRLRTTEAAPRTDGHWRIVLRLPALLLSARSQPLTRRVVEASMTRITRRAAIGLLAAGGALLGLGIASGYVLRDALKSIGGGGIMRTGMMGSATEADMSSYMNLFDRHTEIRRTVEAIDGGVRTTTESNAPDLVVQLQAHVSSMYTHLNQHAEVTCMSSSLPTLFRNSSGYRRELTLTAKGVLVTETSTDPQLANAIRAHAQEVSGFVRDGMPAMMRGMMGH